MRQNEVKEKGNLGKKNDWLKIAGWVGEIIIYK